MDEILRKLTEIENRLSAIEKRLDSVDGNIDEVIHDLLSAIIEVRAGFTDEQKQLASEARKGLRRQS